MSKTNNAPTFEIACDRCHGNTTRYRNVGHGNRCFKCGGAGKVTVSEEMFRAAQAADVAGRRRDAIAQCAAKLRHLTDLGAAPTREARMSEANRLAEWIDDAGANWCPAVCERFLSALRRYVETGSTEKA